MKPPRRRRSLDETLLNPLKTLLTPLRNRRISLNSNPQQVTTAHEKINTTKKNKQDIYAMLPIQDATKKRLKNAIINTPKNYDNKPSIRKNSSQPIFRQLSRQLLRQSFSETAGTVKMRKKGVAEQPNFHRKSESDYDFKFKAEDKEWKDSKKKRYSELYRSVPSMLNESLRSMTLKEIPAALLKDSRCSSEEILDKVSNVAIDDTSANLGSVNRSLSTGDVLKILEEKLPVGRTFSLQRERSFTDETRRPSNHSLSASCKQSAVLSKTSNEKIDNIGTAKTIEDKSSNQSTLKRRKNIFKPLVNRMRPNSIGRDESDQNVKLDNKRLSKLLDTTLEEKVKNLTYDHKLSVDRCRYLSKIIEETLKSKLLKKGKEYKIVALVFIGERRDHGVSFATQCTYNDGDVYAISSVEKENMFVLAVAVATLLEEIPKEILIAK